MAYVPNTEQIYNALLFGVVADGSTDDTAAWNALFVTIASACGGTAYLPPGKRSLCTGALTPMPFGAASPALRIMGGGSYNPFADPASGASILDLRYNGGGSAVAKIDCRGVGRLEIDHLSLVSGGTDDYPFFQTTNTTVHIHDNYVSGHSANSGISCVQDVFILGGTNLSDIGTGASDAPFGGYGTVIERNGFNRIRTGVQCRSAANAIIIGPNFWSSTCGGDTTHGAITIGASALPPTGNVLLANLFETIYYPYPIIFSAAAHYNIGLGNGIWDWESSSHFIASVSDASGNTGNRMIGSYSPDLGSGAPEIRTITTSGSVTLAATGTYLVVCVGGGGAGGSSGTP